MLPAIGAASLALDAVQSLTSPSIQPKDTFGPALSDITDSLPASSPTPSTASGFGSTQISSHNISTLLDAQSLTSADLGSSTSHSSQGSAASASGTASSAYSAINQLAQSTALPLGLNPFSVSV